MPMIIPADVTVYTQQALTALISQAQEEYDGTFAAASADDGLNATDEQLDRLDTLSGFLGTARGHLATFAAATTTQPSTTDRLAALAATTTTTDPAPTDPAPTITDLPNQPQDTPTDTTTPTHGYLVASAGHDMVAAGQHITIDQAADLVYRRILSVDGTTSVALPAFSARRPRRNDDLVCNGDRGDREVLAQICDETRLPTGRLITEFANAPSLTAAAGWCAVSDTSYEIPTTFAADGILDLPRIPAPRGGVRLYPELLFGTVYGGFTGTNYFSLTEGQVQAGVPKTLVEVGCPDPAEWRLHVRGLGAVTNLLAAKALPEYTREFIDGATTGFATFENANHIAAIVAGSVAVNLAADPLWASDGSVFSQVMAAAEMAAVDIRAAKMLKLDHTIEMVFPVWVLPQIRADLMRRNGLAPNESLVADQIIIREFVARNIRAQFVRNYQDAWSGAGGVGLGQAARLTQLPTALEFLAYPVGTWVVAELPVITVSVVYDAVRLVANQRLELFTESGWRVIPRLTGSWRYQLAICPTGATGAQHTISCEEQQT